MKAKIAEMLEALNDGKWHTQKEVQQKTGLEWEKIREIIKFFRDYGFMIMDEKERIKLDEGFRKFLIKTSL